MQIRGKLSDRSPADLIEWLHGEKKSGVLRFWHPPGPIRKDVWFEKGEIVSSGTTEAHEFLGQFLIASGKIDEAAFVRAYRAQLETKVLFGKVLAMYGLVTEAEVATALREKTEETIWEVFLWRDGLFEFDESAVLGHERLPMDIDVGGLIAEGERRVIEWGVIRLTFPHLGVEVRKENAATGGLEPRQVALLEEIGRGKPLLQLALEMRLPTFRFLRRVNDLRKRGLVEVVRVVPPDEYLPEGAIEPLTETGTLSFDPEHVPDLPADSEIPSSERFPVGDGKTLTAAELRPLIPVVKIAQREMLSMKFSAEEGYLLSRIDGIYDVGTVVSLCPFRESLALGKLGSLVSRGILALQQG